MLRHALPSPEAARQFLNRFHAQEKLDAAKESRKPEQLAFIPEEGDARAGLGAVNHKLVQELGWRCAEQRMATVDQDATIIESHKREALRTYEGGRGYQPMLAVWAEIDVVRADEFRDGNVPAMMSLLTVAKRAFAALPETVEEYYYRRDSACHEHELLNVLTALKRIALPAELLRVRPKRLRFLMINTAGRIVQHARKTVLRPAALVDRIALWREAMRLLPIAT
ncbi:MAG: hypothetical protein ACP5E5_14350 [Acidobacteriaceae bacterium]